MPKLLYLFAGHGVQEREPGGPWLYVPEGQHAAATLGEDWKSALSELQRLVLQTTNL